MKFFLIILLRNQIVTNFHLRKKFEFIVGTKEFDNAQKMSNLFIKTEHFFTTVKFTFHQ